MITITYTIHFNDDNFNTNENEILDILNNMIKQLQVYDDQLHAYFLNTNNNDLEYIDYDDNYEEPFDLNTDYNDYYPDDYPDEDEYIKEKE